jgi:GNAT superfamily N-acetyltransferase
VSAQGWSVAPIPVGDPLVVDLLRRYFADVATSFYGRPATDDEVTAALIEDPSADLAPPTGLFLVARYADAPAGCVGLLFGPAGFAKLTRMFVVPAARGHGGAAALLAEAEERARLAGAHTMRLDTRLDLVPARTLYTKHGYRPIPAYSTGPFAQCWYGKDLH